jgi:hypothetical protein
LAETSSRAGDRGAAALATVATLAAALLPLIYLTAFAGDAQVHLVFAENAARGDFFTFNPGEPVAGETSPGYMMLGALLYLLLPAAAVPLALKALGIASFYAFVGLVYRVAARGLGHRGWALVAALAVALMPGTAYNATVGMENGLFAAVVWLWLELASRWAWLEADDTRATHEGALAALLVLACWLRPEGVIVTLAALGTRLGRARRRGAVRPGLWAGPALALVLGLGALAFQRAETGTWAATSILSRRLMAAQQALGRGPLFIDPGLSLRLLAYAPLTALWLWSRPAAPERPAVERLGLLLFAVFFVLFTVGTGAAHLARYTIFLWPAVAIGAARGARRMWAGDAGWLRGRGRGVVAAAACALAAVYAIEADARWRSYPHNELHEAVVAPAGRTERTNQLLDQLGRPGAIPVVLAYEEIQIRYELDDRVVIRSLDGRVDPELLACAHRSVVDQACYLARRHVDFVMQTLPAGPDPHAWSLLRLRALHPGESATHGGLTFTALGGTRAYAVAPAGR